MSGTNDEFAADVRALTSATSTSTEKQAAAILIRKRLATEASPPIDEALEAGVGPALVECLGAADIPSLQLEAAWALTNICGGETHHVKALMDCSVLPRMVELLNSPGCNSHDDIAEQAAWALGNIAGDSAPYRDIVLKSQALPLLVEKFKDPDIQLPFQRTATWALSNMCRGKPPPPAALVQPAVPCLVDLLASSDTETSTDACWALVYLLDGATPERIQAVLAAGSPSSFVGTGLQAARLRLSVAKIVHDRLGQSSPCPKSLDTEVFAQVASYIVQGKVGVRLASLLDDTRELSEQAVAMTAFAHVATGNTAHKQLVIDSVSWPGLLRKVSHTRSSVQIDACVTVSHIAAGTSAQLQGLISCGLVAELASLREGVGRKSQIAVVRALAAVAAHVTEEQVLRDFAPNFPSVSVMLEALLCSRHLYIPSSGDAEDILRILVQALDGVSKILQALTKGSDDPGDYLADEPSVVDDLEALTVSCFGDQVNKQAKHLLEAYFAPEIQPEPEPELESESTES